MAALLDVALYTDKLAFPSQCVWGGKIEKKKIIKEARAYIVFIVLPCSDQSGNGNLLIKNYLLV